MLRRSLYDARNALNQKTALRSLSKTSDSPSPTPTKLKQKHTQSPTPTPSPAPSSNTVAAAAAAAVDPASVATFHTAEMQEEDFFEVEGIYGLPQVHDSHHPERKMRAERDVSSISLPATGKDKRSAPSSPSKSKKPPAASGAKKALRKGYTLEDAKVEGFEHDYSSTIESLELKVGKVGLSVFGSGAPPSSSSSPSSSPSASSADAYAHKHKHWDERDIYSSPSHPTPSTHNYKKDLEDDIKCMEMMYDNDGATPDPTTSEINEVKKHKNTTPLFDFFKKGLNHSFLHGWSFSKLPLKMIQQQPPSLAKNTPTHKHTHELPHRSRTQYNGSTHPLPVWIPFLSGALEPHSTPFSRERLKEAEAEEGGGVVAGFSEVDIDVVTPAVGNANSDLNSVGKKTKLTPQPYKQYQSSNPESYDRLSKEWTARHRHSNKSNIKNTNIQAPAATTPAAVIPFIETLEAPECKFDNHGFLESLVGDEDDGNDEHHNMWRGWYSLSSPPIEDDKKVHANTYNPSLKEWWSVQERGVDKSMKFSTLASTHTSTSTNTNTNRRLTTGAGSTGYGGTFDKDIKGKEKAEEDRWIRQSEADKAAAARRKEGEEAEKAKKKMTKKDTNPIDEDVTTTTTTTPSSKYKPTLTSFPHPHPSSYSHIIHDALGVDLKGRERVEEDRWVELKETAERRVHSEDEAKAILASIKEQEERENVVIVAFDAAEKSAERAEFERLIAEAIDKYQVAMADRTKVKGSIFGDESAAIKDVLTAAQELVDKAESGGLMTEAVSQYREDAANQRVDLMDVEIMDAVQILKDEKKMKERVYVADDFVDSRSKGEVARDTAAKARSHRVFDALREIDAKEWDALPSERRLTGLEFERFVKQSTLSALTSPTYEEVQESVYHDEWIKHHAQPSQFDSLKAKKARAHAASIDIDSPHRIAIQSKSEFYNPCSKSTKLTNNGSRKFTTSTGTPPPPPLDTVKPPNRPRPPPIIYPPYNPRGADDLSSTTTTTIIVTTDGDVDVDADVADWIEKDGGMISPSSVWFQEDVERKVKRKGKDAKNAKVDSSFRNDSDDGEIRNRDDWRVENGWKRGGNEKK